jgi:RHS repeat-associated protein
VKRTVAGVTLLFTYDDWKPIIEWNSAGAWSASNVYGAGPDEILARNGSGQQLTYKQDQHGNVMAVLGSTGSVVEKYTYDAFGAPKVLNGSGTVLPNGTAVANRFLFQGREWIAELAVYDYRHRFYQPDLGRFLQVDPMGLQTEGAKLTPDQKTLYGAGAPEAFGSSEMNLYRYCGDDPVNKNDPFGVEENSKENLAKRAEIDRIARSKDGSQEYRKDVAKGEFGKGTNKCNKFVGDVTKKAGAPMKVSDADTGKARIPMAGESGDKNQPIKDWRVLKPNEAPKPGDVAAYKLTGGGSAFSGHTGIIVNDKAGGTTNISAHADGVYSITGQFENNTDTIYRRYTGD